MNAYGHVIVSWPEEYGDESAALWRTAEKGALSLGGRVCEGPPEIRDDTPDRMMRGLIYYRFPMVRL